MHIAYYTPLKSPGHAVPSGDRTMARALRTLLRGAGHQVRTVDNSRTGSTLAPATAQTLDRDRTQKRYGDYALAPPGQRAPALDLWLTYHVYYKRPDWIGPTLARKRNVPYCMAEVSYAPKRAAGPWDLGHRAVAACIEASDLILNLNPIDANCVRPLMRPHSVLLDVPPFLPVAAYRKALRDRAAHAAALRARLALPSDTPILLCVAMMRAGDKLASYQVLGDALSRLGDRDWHLVVAGDGEARSEVEAALAPLGTRASYLGEQAAAGLPALYAACDLYVWPAINEAWGMTLLEAQAAGLPVVAGRTGGVPNVVQEGIAGLLPPVRDAAAFAAAVAELLDQPQRRRAFAAAAAERMRLRHDMAVVRRTVDAALHETVARFRTENGPPRNEGPWT